MPLLINNPLLRRAVELITGMQWGGDVAPELSLTASVVDLSRSPHSVLYGSGVLSYDVPAVAGQYGWCGLLVPSGKVMVLKMFGVWNSSGTAQSYEMRMWRSSEMPAITGRESLLCGNRLCFMGPGSNLPKIGIEFVSGATPAPAVGTMFRHLWVSSNSIANYTMLTQMLSNGDDPEGPIVLGIRATVVNTGFRVSVETEEWSRSPMQT